MSWHQDDDIMLSSDSDEVREETTTTESFYNDHNSVILTFTLTRSESKLQISRIYYVSLTSPGYHIDQSTEKRKAPGGFVTPFVLPPTIPAQAYVSVRLHRNETKFRLAKFHEAVLRAERIRCQIESHITLYFKDAPDLIMHVEKLPCVPPARAFFETIPRFIGTAFCGAGTSVSCATIISRRRADGTWAPVLHQEVMPNERRHHTPVLYEPGRLDNILLRIEAFTIRKAEHRRLKRRATMLCSLHFLLETKAPKRLILRRPRGHYFKINDTKQNENGKIAGLLDFRLLPHSTLNLTAYVEVGIVIFGCRVTPENYFDLNPAIRSEAPVINVPLPMVKHVGISMQTLNQNGCWRADPNDPPSISPAIQHLPLPLIKHLGDRTQTLNQNGWWRTNCNNSASKAPLDTFKS